MKNIFLIIIIAFVVSSCQQAPKQTLAFSMADKVGMEEEIIPITRQEEILPPIPPTPPLETKEVIKKKIIKDGRIDIEVQELDKTKALIDSLVARHGGYYANEKLNNNSWEISYSLTIRIPCANFERLVSSLDSGTGEIKYKEIDARDVTDQFIDLETRLENKKSYLKSYKDLLKQAKSVKDILEIQEKVRVIEEEIESSTGQLKYLSDLVDYSTLDVTITKNKEYKNEPKKRDAFLKRVKQALSKGWFGFVDFIVFVFKVWPFWIILYIIIHYWKKYRKRRKNK